ncbi:MAG TPA: serine hydrolase [Candidatus Paceibacterota bacterium]|nr:serine hydrolase [Candidatus Paceibacterota bacterium]
MYDRPHSFDTRGFLFAALCLVAAFGLLTAIRYGTVFASEHLRKSQTALVTPASAEEFTSIEDERAVEASGGTAPSRFTISDKPLPHVSAKAFIVGDMETGTIFAHKNAAVTYPIASITKLLTALTAKELLPDGSAITLNADDRRQTEGTPGSITLNESFPMEEALKALLTESNNSISYALARAAGTDAFMAEMHTNAKEAGMRGATFEDPSGISSRNRANAVDIFLLTRHLYDEAPDILAMTRATGETITAKSGRRYSLGNFNVFHGDDRFLGGKTGYTNEARETMTTVFEVPVDGETATVAFIVLGSEDRKADIEKLRTWFRQAASKVE